jgi:uncharacterized membrane protein
MTGSPWTDAYIPLICVFLFAFIALVSGIWFFLRRAYEPIRSRRPVLVLFHIGFISFGVVLKCTAAFLNPDVQSQANSDTAAPSVRVACWINLILPSLFLSFSAVMFLARAALVHVDSRISQHSIEIVSTQTTAESRARMINLSWVLVNKNTMNSTKNLILFCILVAVVTGLVPLLNVVITDSTALGIQDSRSPICLKAIINMTAFCGGALAFGIVMTAIILVVGYRRRINESLGIRQEIAVCLLAMIFSFSLIVINANSEDTAPNTFHALFGFRGYQLFELMLPVLVIVWQSFILPVKKSYEFNAHSGKTRTHSRSTGSSTEVLKESFLHLLQSESGFSIFQEFLKSELSVENILFWRDVQKFKEMTIEPEAIYETYIPYKAPLCINISASVRKDLELCFEGSPEHQSLLAGVSHADLDVFDEAHEEIFNLMLKDSFMRFMKTPGYIAWLRNSSAKL